MSLNYVEKRVYDAADAGDAAAIDALMAAYPLGTADLNRRNPLAV